MSKFIDFTVMEFTKETFTLLVTANLTKLLDFSAENLHES